MVRLLLLRRHFRYDIEILMKAVKRKIWFGNNTRASGITFFLLGRIFITSIMFFKATYNRITTKHEKCATHFSLHLSSREFLLLLSLCLPVVSTALESIIDFCVIRANV